MAEREALLALAERLEAAMRGTTARPWRAFDRGGVLAVMKGNEPPRDWRGYHTRRWPEIIAWSGFDGAHVAKRQRAPNLHMIVEVVNALPEIIAALRAAQGNAQ